MRSIQRGRRRRASAAHKRGLMISPSESRWRACPARCDGQSPQPRPGSADQSASAASGARMPASGARLVPVSPTVAYLATPARQPGPGGAISDLAGAGRRRRCCAGRSRRCAGNASGGVIALFSAGLRERRFEIGLDAGSAGLRQGCRVGFAAPSWAKARPVGHLGHVDRRFPGRQSGAERRLYQPRG